MCRGDSWWRVAEGPARWGCRTGRGALIGGKEKRGALLLELETKERPTAVEDAAHPPALEQLVPP